MLFSFVIFLCCLPPYVCKNIVNFQQYNTPAECLSNGEALIVFSVSPDSSGDAYYSAYVFKYGMAVPSLYSICSEKSLFPFIDDDYINYNDGLLLSKILSPLSHELQNIETIYFIPSGIMHQMALEYLVDMKGKMLCEKYNVFRLSSPRVLLDRYSRKKYNRMSMWGGIDFYSDLAGITNYMYSDSTSISKCNLGYLEESYRAAKRINEEMLLQGIESSFYCDGTATEERFKSEQWNNVDVFLIETHGLFLSNYVDVSTQGKDNPMENHALALVGASYVLEGGIVPDSIDDGILTAKEISELDMHNVDLAVVSACKSALGEIREDGVYGLMRGFKLAGVRSLIMATDDIVDYVAGQLWIQLFRNLAKGMTKREALLEGLKYIRTMDDGAFSHPKYWTPFILIDGVE